MAKVYGLMKDYAPVRETYSQVIASYEMVAEPDGRHATWHEVYFNKKQTGKPSATMMKDAIIADINAQTDEKILNGMVWNGIHVWLSAENQRNFSEAQRMAERYGDAVLPLRFKLGENDDELPIYHTFETSADLDAFYKAAFAFVNQCLNEGWQRKDSIDWNDYKQ